MESFNSLMKQAQSSKNANELEIIVNKIMKNKKKFPLVQLKFAEEFLLEKLEEFK
jgi:hypothetical protein